MVTKIKLYNPSASELVSDWHVIDASGKVLGRLASEAATLLMGKHRPEYVPHMLSGDFVVITNAAEVKVTGNKADQIVYRRHSQKPGKLKEVPFRRIQDKFPERIIEHAVRGMLPKNKLGERMIRRLKVYAGEEHPHVSQLTWTAGRPERDALAAAKAEEEAQKRAENRRLAAARKDIAASAAMKTAAEAEPVESGEEPIDAVEVNESSDQPEAQVIAPVESEVTETVVVEEEAPKKKAPARKPAAKRASTSKASTTKPKSATTTRKKPAASKAKSTTSKATPAKAKAPAAKSSATTSRKTTTTRKSPATRKTDSK